MMLDLGRPMCLVLTGLLEHCSPDTDLPHIVRRYVDRMAPGSLVIISHLTLDGLDPTDPTQAEILNGLLTAQRSFEDGAQDPLFFRGRKAFTEILTSLEVVSPGVVWTYAWPQAMNVASREADLPVCFAAVGRVR
jgi:S-adenosyl methyltransferase